MTKKRLRPIRKRQEPARRPAAAMVEEKEAPVQKRQRRSNAALEFYDNNYKKLLIIPFLILVLAIGQILYQNATTGDFMNKGVSLKGGVTITVPVYDGMDALELESFLASSYPQYEISARAISSLGTEEGILVEADANTKEEAEQIVASIAKHTSLKASDMGVDLIGSALGASFFEQTFRAVLAAFIFMGWVVFLYFAPEKCLMQKIIASVLTLFGGGMLMMTKGSFVYPVALVTLGILIYLYVRYSIPSFAVILAAFADIVITLAIVNLIGIKVSTAGVAAFLMLIGYSIDTDILLSVRVLKRKEGDIFSRIIDAMKTGLTMNLTTMAALVVGIILSDSEVLTQIMSILLIGLFVDIINTWIQNVGILRLYLERKGQ